MIIEEGKWYRRSDGKIVGPAEWRPTIALFPWSIAGRSYSKSGVNYEGSTYIVEEVPEPGSEAPSTPGSTITKQAALDKASAAVADRGLNYGAPEQNFARIARLWNAHLVNRYGASIDKHPSLALPHLDAADVAMLLAQVKMARLQNQPSHLDSWVDIAGYAACGAEIAGAQ